MSILAFEGPAGTGKSTLARIEAREHGRTLLERPTTPRAHSSGMGAWTSSYLEYMVVSAATCMPEHDYVVDRFLLSRWVYRSFDGRGELPEGWRREMETSLEDLKLTALSESVRRMGLQKAPLPAVHVHVDVLMPSLRTLQTQRNLSGEEYPFDAAAELRLYGEVYAGLMRHPIRGLTLGLIKDWV